MDAGCGSGYGTYYLSKNGANMIVGIDRSTIAIKYVKKYKNQNIDFIQMDVCDLKFKDGSFDKVISFDVLEHLDDESQIKFISEI